MVATRSLIFGSLSHDLSTTTLRRSTPVQEFARDEVLVAPSLDPYIEIARANRVLSSGKSLALEAEERSRRSIQRKG